ncbi:hypothetical protein LTR16_012502, partial [Cryomyces antarcticus]
AIRTIGTASRVCREASGVGAERIPTPFMPSRRLSATVKHREAGEAECQHFQRTSASLAWEGGRILPSARRPRPPHSRLVMQPLYGRPS